MCSFVSTPSDASAGRSAAPWKFAGELPEGAPGRFVVCDAGDAVERRFDCELLASACAAFLGTGFFPLFQP